MSKLTEEIKRLSRKIDNIDQRVEKIENKQPKITVKVSTGCDSSVSISNPKFKVGDKFIPHKPKKWNGSLSWTKEMDEYDGKILTVAHIAPDGDIESNTDKHWWFSPSWCTKVEEPKFKKGDWVRSLITGTVGKVEAFYEAGSRPMYWLSTIDGKYFTYRENLLEPYFPKEGEYVFAKPKTSYECIFIYSHTGEYNGEIRIFDKASLFPDFKICLVNTNPLAQVKALENIRPATSEEKALLDSELAKRGLIFDGKEIVNNNTPKVGDFCIFWDENKGTAFCAILERMINAPICKYGTRDGLAAYIHCVKFESEEQFRKIKEGKI